MIQVAKTRIVVVQGLCLLRDALICRFQQESWVQIVGVAKGLDEAVAITHLYYPDVLIMNISPKCSVGVASIRKIKRENQGLKIIAFSCDSELENTFVGQVLRAGADGYVSSNDSLEALVRAVHKIKGSPRVMENDRYVSERGWENKKEQSVLMRLSHNEAEVFCFIGCGYGTRAIAQKMGVSPKTIETYSERIRKKLGFTKGADFLYASTTLMRMAARRNGEIPDDEAVKELLSAID